jgi:hypothetical protein
VNSTIWTCLTLNASLLTACLPSIKRLLVSWAAGVHNNGIREAYDIQNSSNMMGSGQVSNNPRSFQRSNQSALNRSRSKHEIDEAAYTHYTEERNSDGARGDDSESKKGLTDGIMQTIDYRVEYSGDRFSQENVSTFRGL